MLQSGHIEAATRGPFLNPVFLVPKSTTEYRFILDCSALTAQLPAPPFLLPPLPRVLHFNPVPPRAFMCKLDLAEAFYHFRLAPSTRRLTTFRLDGNYYRFVRMPFGLRPAPFYMQTFATALTRHLRAQGLWAWSHIDNLLVAHTDPALLSTIVTEFVADLARAGIRINPRDTQLQPTQKISFLGFQLNTATNTIAHLPSHVQATDELLSQLRSSMPKCVPFVCCIGIGASVMS